MRTETAGALALAFLFLSGGDAPAQWYAPSGSLPSVPDVPRPVCAYCNRASGHASGCPQGSSGSSSGSSTYQRPSRPYRPPREPTAAEIRARQEREKRRQQRRQAEAKAQQRRREAAKKARKERQEDRASERRARDRRRRWQLERVEHQRRLARLREETKALVARQEQLIAELTGLTGSGPPAKKKALAFAVPPPVPSPDAWAEGAQRPSGESTFAWVRRRAALAAKLGAQKARLALRKLKEDLLDDLEDYVGALPFGPAADKRRKVREFMGDVVDEDKELMETILDDLRDNGGLTQERTGRTVDGIFAKKPEQIEEMVSPK